jgi:hypothetical protein
LISTDSIKAKLVKSFAEIFPILANWEAVPEFPEIIPVVGSIEYGEIFSAVKVKFPEPPDTYCLQFIAVIS